MKQNALVFGSVFGAIGAAVTTLGATLCCVGPIVVTLLGVSGAVAVAKLEPYTLHLFVGSFVMLAFGFYASYRGACATGNGTCPPGQRGVRVMLWCATFLTMSTFLLNRLGILAG